MHVVRQDHPGIDVERRAPSNVPHGGPQRIRVHHQKSAAAVKKIDRKEIGPFSHTMATIIRHVRQSAASGGSWEGKMLALLGRIFVFVREAMADDARAYPPYNGS